LQVKPLYDQQYIRARIALGDQQAFALFFKHHWPQVYGTGLRLTKSPGKAQDLAQDIFMKLWENRHRLPEVKEEDAYIYTLSRNVILDLLRKKVFDTGNIGILIDYFEDRTISAQEKLEYNELEQTLKSAIDQLPGKVKDVFVLSRVKGLTHEQIAQQLGISIVSSKTYVVRALQDIRKYMALHTDNTTLILAAAAILYGLSK
jgi:RNA polymerase sigma-70 factor (ECF subfamily)